MEKTSIEKAITNSSLNKAISKSSLLRLVLGMLSILASMSNLALLRFGPYQSTALTVGDAASIATSLILALTGMAILRND